MMLCKLGSKFLNIIKLLLNKKYKINLDIQDHEGKTALIHNIIKNSNDCDIEITKLLIDRGCIHNLLCNNRTALSIAKEKGFVKHAKYIESQI